MHTETHISRGKHSQTGGRVWVKGTGALNAHDCPLIVVSDRASVHATGKTRVSAYDNATVFAGRGQTVEVFGTPTIVHTNGVPDVVIGFGEPNEILEVKRDVNLRPIVVGNRKANRRQHRVETRITDRGVTVSVR